MFFLLNLIFFIITLIFWNKKNKEFKDFDRYLVFKRCFLLSLGLLIVSGIFTFDISLDLEEIENMEKEIKICKQDNESI